ncbi:MAG: hypothetical protein OXE46_01220 [Chloroflexi bacterium]|nr:hypothetical protein [Chloroflexota bacterium]
MEKKKFKNEEIYDAGYDEGYEAALATHDLAEAREYEEGFAAGRRQAARRKELAKQRAYERGLLEGEAYIAEAAYKKGLAAGARNKTAFTIGLIAGIFGLWGLAHIINDKVGSGIVWMFVGMPIAAILMGGLAATGIGAIAVPPLWIYSVYSHAKNGASYI